MAQTFLSTDVVSTTNVFADNQSQRVNENTLRSNFSGTSQPSDPVVGQQWYDTANSKTWQYNGTAWVAIDINSTTQLDVSNSKGSLASLTSYLRVAHNDDGTLKTTPASSIDEFKDNSLVITYVSATSFRVPSDLTSIFTANRKLKVYLSASTVITYVSSSTYDSGNSWTVVTVGSSVLDSSITAVKYSIVQYGEREDTVHTSDLSGYVTEATLASYAPLANPNFSGIVSVPTATAGTDTTQAASTAFVANALSNFTIEVYDHIAGFVATVASNTTITISSNIFSEATLNTANVGALGLDTGSLAASTWYYLHAMWGTAGYSFILSASPTSPTLPNGYTKHKYMGAFLTDASSHLYRIRHVGKNASYLVDGTILTSLPLMASGAAGSITTPTWVSVNVNAFIPTTSQCIKITVYTDNGAMVAPNGNYGAYNSTSNPAPVMYNVNIANASTMLLESRNIYYASITSAFRLRCIGWEENI